MEWGWCVDRIREREREGEGEGERFIAADVVHIDALVLCPCSVAKRPRVSLT